MSIEMRFNYTTISLLSDVANHEQNMGEQSATSEAYSSSC